MADLARIIRIAKDLGWTKGPQSLNTIRFYRGDEPDFAIDSEEVQAALKFPLEDIPKELVAPHHAKWLKVRFPDWVNHHDVDVALRCFKKAVEPVLLWRLENETSTDR